LFILLTKYVFDANFQLSQEDNKVNKVLKILRLVLVIFLVTLLMELIYILSLCTQVVQQSDYSQFTTFLKDSAKFIFGVVMVASLFVWYYFPKQRNKTEHR